MAYYRSFPSHIYSRYVFIWLVYFWWNIKRTQNQIVSCHNILMQTRSGSVEGKQFEAIFQKICRLKGYLARKMPLSAVYTGPWRKLQPVKSELDFQVIHIDHGPAFLDCKTFQGERFMFSQLNPHQVGLAFQYNNWNVRAGFVVWFREVNQVVFYSGQTIVAKGSGSSFGIEDGILLGNVPNFDLGAVFNLKLS